MATFTFKTPSVGSTRETVTFVITDEALHSGYDQTDPWERVTQFRWNYSNVPYAMVQEFLAFTGARQGKLLTFFDEFGRGWRGKITSNIIINQITRSEISAGCPTGSALYNMNFEFEGARV